jgi:hypothetical protein
MTWTRLTCLRVQRVAGSCECGYGHFISVTTRRISWLADELVVFLGAHLHGVIKLYNAHLQKAVCHIQISATNCLSGLTSLCSIFIVAPCILKIHQILHTNKETNHILYISLKLLILKHFHCSYMFR